MLPESDAVERLPLEGQDVRKNNSPLSFAAEGITRCPDIPKGNGSFKLGPFWRSQSIFTYDIVRSEVSKLRFKLLVHTRLFIVYVRG